MSISDNVGLYINEKYDEYHCIYELKDAKHYGLSINHGEFLGSLGGLCAGLSMFWLFCMAKEKYPSLSFGIRHFYTKITPKNKDKYLPLEGITRRNFKEISRYINRKYKDNINSLYEQKIVKLKNSLTEYHKISNKIFKTTTCGVCSLNDNNKGFDFKEFFKAITIAIDSNKNREVYITISSLEHSMALYARRSNLNGLLDSYYEFIFFDPNDSMGESMPLILNFNQFRTKQDILNKFRNLFGKERRNNYFTGYQDYFFYNIFELSDLKPYMITNQNRLFSKDCESLKFLKILGIKGYLKKDEEMRLFYILYQSSALGIYPVVKALKEFKGIDPNISDTDGTTPLFMASQNGHTEIVKVLIEFKGIDLNKADNNGVTPLYMASQNGHTEIVKVLIEFKGIDLNKADNDGITPLYIASQNGHTEVVKTLLGFKAYDPYIAKKDKLSSLKIVSDIIKFYENLKSNGHIFKPKEEYEKIYNILSKLLVPVAAPRNIRPVAAPRNIHPVAAPRNIRPVAAPRNIRPVAAPRNIRPVAAPRNIHPVAAPRNKPPEANTI